MKAQVCLIVSSAPTKLRQLREELNNPKLSQERLAHLAGITQVTYRRAEAGNKVQYSTGKAILDALNKERQSRQLPPVTLDDLGLSLE
jgi:predicted transcriptional regulator